MNRRHLVVCAFVVSACATARIDVDAYVGPLANTEEVQLQQTIAMAIGAKPLLVQLRDLLETSGRDGVSSLELRNLPGYEADYIVPRTGGEPWFHNANAERINSILHLYRDLEDPLVAALRAEAENYRGHYERLVSIGPEHEADEALMTRMHKGHPGLDPAFERFLLPMNEEGRSGPPFRDARAIVALAHERMGRDRDAVAIELRGSGPKPVTLNFADLRRNTRGGRPSGREEASRPFSDLGANVTFAFLEEERLWEGLAEDLGLEDALGKQLIERGSAVARSFHEARRSLRRMFTLAAQLARRHLEQHLTSGMSTQDATKALLPVAGLLSRGPLLSAQEGVTSHEENPLYRSLGRGAQGIWNKMHEARVLDFDGPPEGTITTILQKLAEPDSPVATCKAALAFLDATLEVDQACRSPAVNFQSGWWSAEWVRSTNDDKLIRAISYSKRAYGLLSGPTHDPKGAAGATAPFVPEATALTSIFNQIRGEHGLDTGRLPIGLDGLVTEYLQSAPTGYGSPSLPARTRVLLALTQFAEKLRVMSGFQGLVDSNARQNARQYVDVLTAIASSMLSQLDSLHRQTDVLDADDRLQRLDPEPEVTPAQAGERERAAWRSVANEPPIRLPKACEVKPDSQAQVLRQLLARLRYLLVDQTLLWGADSAECKRVRQAIDLVHEHLSGVAFIRPAIEYLRSSSPASNLTQDPLLLTPRILGNASPDRLNDQQRQTAIELDKQYWRNVNTVVVDGVGRTQYVLAKDDIGNWQVKSVANDVSEMMKAMGGLASFGLGGGLTPLAKLDAANYQNLLDKARAGNLADDDKKAIDDLRQRERDATNRSGLLGTHATLALQATDALVVRMRDAAWIDDVAVGDDEAAKKANRDKVKSAWQPREPAAVPDEGPWRDRLRASKARYDQVLAYWRTFTGGDGVTDAVREGIAQARGKHLDKHEGDRAGILHKLRNSLDVLSTPPPKPKS